MSRICLYYRQEPEKDRWVQGDRFIRPLLRRLIRGPRQPLGVDKVFINLCLGLDRLGIAYQVNMPFQDLKPGDQVGVLGAGLHCLDGYEQKNPIVAGIGLMSLPTQWPSLCTDYPVVTYLQACPWATELYKPYFGDRCQTWPVGIDTETWKPNPGIPKSVDVLLYNKICWNHELVQRELVNPVRDVLRRRGKSFEEVRYGAYRSRDYQAALQRARAMIFLCQHESQGIAYQEALSCGVPILAWDAGKFMDPNWPVGVTSGLPVSSVPYWDSRCGMKFQDLAHFESVLDSFEDGLKRGAFSPRSYILENLTLEKRSSQFIEFLSRASHS